MHYRLLLIAALIGLISVAGGALVLAAGSGFDDWGEAVWWAFLRLSDPGYLGDDVGTVNRVVSTALTVLGYVVFLGALVAVMTQWLWSRMQRLESGLTPVARDDHVVVLGWTNRTEAIVRELLVSKERVRRFLRRHGIDDLHVVVLAEDVTSRLAQDLRDAVGDPWEERLVTLRSGNALRMEHLERVDFRNASAILVPASEFDGAGTARTDSHTIKTLLSLAGDGAGAASGGDGADPGALPEEEATLPYVVAEILDSGKVHVARRAYPGPFEAVSSDVMVSRLLAQNVRHPGLSRIYGELLTRREGNEIYLRDGEGLDDVPVEELAARFDRGVFLGLVRRRSGGFRPLLNPDPGTRVREGDQLVVLAERIADTRPGPAPTEDRGAPGTRSRGAGPVSAPARRSVLLLGWNHRVPALVREFDSYGDERYDLTCLSTVPTGERETALARHGIDADRDDLRLVEGDYTDATDLASVDPAAHDAVVLVGVDWLEGEEEADARAILGLLLLDDLLPVDGSEPGVIVELLDPENVPLLGRRRNEVLISPVVLSHVLAHVALRRELRVVFDELFTAGGAEIVFRSPSEYGLENGRHAAERVRRAVWRHGETFLGVDRGEDGGALELNPPRTRHLELGPGHRLVSLATLE